MHPVRLVRLLRKYDDCDFIMGHGFPFNIVLPVLKVMGFIGKGKKIIYFQHHRLMNSSGSAFQKMVYKRLFSCFDVIIANSMDVRDDVLAIDARLAGKIVIFNSGLDFEHTKELSRRALSVDIAISRRSGSVHLSGSVPPHKNHEIFIKILSKLEVTGTIDKFFAIFSAGDNELKKKFSQDVASHGYQKYCLLPDRLSHDDLLHLMGASNVCLFPSLEEGFGLAILEALVLGISVLSFKNVIPLELGA